MVHERQFMITVIGNNKPKIVARRAKFSSKNNSSKLMATHGNVSTVMKMEMNMYFVECIMKLDASRERVISTFEFEGLPQSDHGSFQTALIEVQYLLVTPGKG